MLGPVTSLSHPFPVHPIPITGGQLHILPCSHVGHIFRDSHPYTVPNRCVEGENKAGYFLPVSQPASCHLCSTINETFLRNSIRLAEVWMDEYKELFYGIRPSARKVRPTCTAKEHLYVALHSPLTSYSSFIQHLRSTTATSASGESFARSNSARISSGIWTT